MSTVFHELKMLSFWLSNPCQVDIKVVSWSRKWFIKKCLLSIWQWRIFSYLCCYKNNHIFLTNNFYVKLTAFNLVKLFNYWNCFCCKGMKYVLLTESLSDDMCVEINDDFVGLTGILVTSFIGKNNMLTKEVVNCSYYL